MTITVGAHAAAFEFFTSSFSDGTSEQGQVEILDSREAVGTIATTCPEPLKESGRYIPEETWFGLAKFVFQHSRYLSDAEEDAFERAVLRAYSQRPPGTGAKDI